MNVQIQKIKLLNFKGIKDLEVNFKTDSITDILGDNGLGKTTIFDAYTWALFEKDSQDRKDFGIKTYGRDGKVIPQIPHEVSIDILVDGVPMNITKKLVEKWVTKRGTSTPEFTGNEVKRFINDVPMTERECQDKINSIIPESLIRLITNPFYFTSQKTNIQRDMLFSLAGSLTDSDVLNAHPEFLELFNNITGKTIEEYKREIKSKISRIKDEMSGIPDRIDEVQRGISQISSAYGEYDSLDEVWNQTTRDITTKKTEISTIEKQLEDSNNIVVEEQNKRRAKIDEIGKLKEEKQRLEQEISHEKMQNYNTIESALQTKRNEVENLKNTNVSLKSQLDTLTQNKKSYQEKIYKLTTEFHELYLKKIEFNEGEFVCPTCQREFDQDKIEEMQISLTNNFNSSKAAKLKEIETAGNTARTSLNDANDRINNLNKEIDSNNIKIDSICVQLDGEQVPKPIVNEDIYKTYPKWVSISSKITEEEAKLIQSVKEPNSNIELKDKKSELEKEVEELNKKLNDKNIITNSKNRIEELTNKLQTLSQEKSNLEKIDFDILNFNKKKIAMIEDKINSFFSIVQFKMFETQINGAEVETCEAMVNGTPFSTQNGAMKINIGLDIINAFCNYNNLFAPVFIDNAESINDILPIKSQLIRLVVIPKKYKCASCGAYGPNQDICECGSTLFTDLTPRDLIIK